uniref:Uncharacterized protein n=1 Tax=uncultured bacterium contig00042 TaxID=1181529 RepID=A0A806KLD4_9BACT|nr:hypothetical protein [uncultured bacterium contig00042]
MRYQYGFYIEVVAFNYFKSHSFHASGINDNGGILLIISAQNIAVAKTQRTILKE